MSCIPFKAGIKPTRKNYEFYIRGGNINGKIIRTPDYTFEFFVQEMNQMRLDKSTGFICGDFDEMDICSDCGCMSDVLCDYPVGDNKTCDRKTCDDCAYEVADDIHYCQSHYEQWRKFVASGGVSEHLKNVIAFKHEK